MQTHHLTGPGELIAAIPVMLGDTPREAVVVVGLTCGGEIVSVASAARADLEITEVARSLGGSIASTLRANEARRVILVSYTEDDVTMGCPAIDALRPSLEPAVDVTDMWACDGERFMAPGCADVDCCPAGGRPVPTSSVSAAARASVSAVGHAAPAVDDDLAPPSRRRSSARAADRWTARRASDIDEWRCESWVECGNTFGFGAPSTAMGRAIASLQDVRVRDAIIVEWLGGSPGAIADTLLGHDSEEVVAVLDGAMRDPGTELPVAGELVASLRWCRQLIAHARRREQAPLYALSAVALWWGGDIAAAADAVQQALRRDPAYSLAILLGDICEAGVVPAWLRSRGNELLDSDVIL